jgi:hypothetical protein
METWKDILECPGYQVSNYGRVRHGFKFIKPVPNNELGHSQIRITIKKRVFRELTHRLVARYFIPNPQNLPIVNHIDNDPTNNMAINLEWCTHSHNQLHSVKTGNSMNRLGSGCHKAKITESEAKEIFELSKLYRITDVSIITGTTASIVHKIKNGYAWNQVTGLPRKRYGDSKTKQIAA